MNTLKRKVNKGGRPRVSPDSRPMTITISQDDYFLLKEVARVTSSNASSIIRDLLTESRPIFNAMIEAIEAANLQKSLPSGSLADKMLKSALSGDIPAQQDLLDIVSSSRDDKK